MGGFTGKNVLVTGGAGGLGRAIGEAFAAEGAALVLVDIDGERLAATCKDLADQGHAVTAITADLSDEAAIRSVGAKLAEAHDRLDVLVNNAALAYGEIAHGFLGLGMEKWQRFFTINTIAPLLLAEAVKPQLAAAKGLIVNQCSMAAYVPGTAYGVTKAALAAMNFAMASHFAADEVRVVGIAPGLMATEANQQSLPPETHERLRAMQLAPKRGGTPQDIANACVFAASEEGSFLNNTILNVDGGHQMRGWRM